MKKKNRKKTTDVIKFETREIKKNKGMNDDYKVMISFIIVLVVIALLVSLLFFFNGKFVTKDHFQDKETTTTEPVKYDSKVVTVPTMFNLSKDPYYVLLYDKKDEKSFLYDDLVSRFDDEDIKLYSVDMSDRMNKAYYDIKGTANKDIKTYKDVLITEPTLLVFKKGKVTEYITGSEKIVNKLV